MKFTAISTSMGHVGSMTRLVNDRKTDSSVTSKICSRKARKDVEASRCVRSTLRLYGWWRREKCWRGHAPRAPGRGKDDAGVVVGWHNSLGRRVISGALSNSRSAMRADIVE